MTAVRIAVVTIAHGRHDHLEQQHRSLAASEVRPDLYLVVAMDDPGIEAATYDGLAREVVRLEADPRGLPLAAARNRGVGAALADGADVVVLLDADCVVAPGLVGAYAAAVLADPTVVWSGPVTYLPPPPPGGYDLGSLAALDDPHPARPAPPPGHRETGGDPDLFWSLSFALGAPAWTRVGGFCESYVGYGGEDTDFGRSILSRGLGLGWDGSARAFHQHHEVERPPIRHLADILRNGRLFADRWGHWPMRGWLEEFEVLGLVRRAGDGGWVGAGSTSPARPAIASVRVVVPVHDEEEHLGRCLASVRDSVAVLRSARPEIEARVVAVLDRCADRSDEIVSTFDVDVVVADAGTVGGARSAGVRQVASGLAHLDPSRVLVANTDADCVVPPSWLVGLVEEAGDHDLVQGEVRPDPADLSAAALVRWEAQNPSGRGSLHGANLAFRLHAYLDVGGFPEIAEHEDLLLVRALNAAGYSAVCGGVPVLTSGRRTGRVPGGFAGYLRDLDAALEPDLT